MQNYVFETCNGEYSFIASNDEEAVAMVSRQPIMALYRELPNNAGFIQLWDIHYGIPLTYLARDTSKV